MENKINRKRKTDQRDRIDKLLEEEYDTETQILESVLLKSAGKTSWDDFPQESEEKIQEGYDRLVSSLKAKGEYRETDEIRKVRERYDNYENEWNVTHRFLRPAAVLAAVVLITTMLGMTAVVDTQPLTQAVPAYHVSAQEKN